MAAAEDIDMRGPRSASAAASSARSHRGIDRCELKPTWPPQHWPISGPSGTLSVSDRRGPSRARRLRRAAAGGGDRHILELAAADRAENRHLRDQHEGAALARRRAFGLDDFDQRRRPPRAPANRVSAPSEACSCRVRLRRLSRSTAISTRSGVAGASSRGHSRDRPRSPPHPTAHAAPTSPA